VNYSQPTEFHISALWIQNLTLNLTDAVHRLEAREAHRKLDLKLGGYRLPLQKWWQLSSPNADEAASSRVSNR